MFFHSFKSTKETGKLKDSSSLCEFKAEIEYDLPNQHLYEFKGSMHIEKNDIKLTNISFNLNLFVRYAFHIIELFLEFL